MGVHASKAGHSRGSTKRQSHSYDFEANESITASNSAVDIPTPSPRYGGTTQNWPSANEGRSGNIARHSRSSSSRTNVRDPGRFVRGDSDAEDILSSTVLDHQAPVGVSPKGPTGMGLPQSGSSTNIGAGNSGSLGRGLSRRTSSSGSLGLLQANASASSSVAAHSRVLSDVEIGHRRRSPSPLRHGTRIAHFSNEHDTDPETPAPASPQQTTRSAFGFLRSRANGSEQGSFSGIGNASTPRANGNDRSSTSLQAANPGNSRGTGQGARALSRSNSFSATRMRSDSGESSFPPQGTGHQRRSSSGSGRSRGSPPPRSSSNTPDTIRREGKETDLGTPTRPILQPSENARLSSSGRSPPRRNSQIASLSQRFRFRSRSRSRSRGVSPSVAHTREYSNNRMQLPNEVVFHICGFMGLRSLGRLANTCRTLAQEDLLWRAMALLTYGTQCHVSMYTGSWRALCMDDNRKNEPFAPPPLVEDQIAMLAFGGEDPPDPRYLHESEPLLDVLFDPNWEMLKVLCATQSEGGVPRQVSKILAGALGLLAENRGVGCSMCCMMVTRRFTTITHPEGLEPVAQAFQTVSLAVDVLVAFLRIRCARFLHTVLGRLVNEVMEMNLELDPQRTKSPGEEAGNLVQLIKAVSDILQTIMNRIDAIPHDVRMLLAHIQSEVIRVSEGRLRDVAGLFAGQIFFLRCIVPALITPYRFGLCTAPPNTAQIRNLVLVAKVIQTISTGALFNTRETFMMPCNEFIKSTMPNVRNFCAVLTSPRYTPDLEQRASFSEAHLASAQHRLLRVITEPPFRRALVAQLQNSYPNLPALLDGSRWGFAKLWSALSSGGGD